jgi:hypothetical protein
LDFNLKSLAKDKVEIPEKLPEDIVDARHQRMLEAIAPYAKKIEQKNLTPVYVDYKTRQTKLVLVLCPEWAPQFPPFNLARLSGVAKSAGYETHIIDLNIRAYKQHQEDWAPNDKLAFRLWNPAASWHWLGETYSQDIHPVLQPILEEGLKEIVALKPDIVGFSIYYINEEPTKWMCQQLKELLPTVKIAVGGSNVQKGWFSIQNYYDYVVNGEGEDTILKILNEVENGITHDTPQYLQQPEHQRINLNNLPMPDYESIDFNAYEIPNGVNTEISRGCTAKCAFCEETHFWRYRQRKAVDLITEIEWLYYNKGTDVIWFIDSLVNGDINELRAFSKAVHAKGLKIHWTGYARCDGRMDLDYYKDLKAGGCIMLNYGIESGSQKILDDMNKGVTVAEMEQNFRDSKAVGIFVATNWIVGFPTESLKDFADTMTFLWRMRNMNINNIGPGVGFGLGPETLVGQNPDKYNLSHHKYQGHWITKDFKLGGTHVMMRVKTFGVFLDLLSDCTEMQFSYPVRADLAKYHYNIRFHNSAIVNEIDYENFDYDIIKVDINPFADSLVNEIWPFLRILWRTRGGFDTVIRFNPDIDLKEFGNQFGPGMFYGQFNFSITESGVWHADFVFKFNQIPNPYDDRPESRRGPFYAQDFSKMQSNTAIRARRLAKPKWGNDGRQEQDFAFLISEEAWLNQNVNFSFYHRYTKSGTWGPDPLLDTDTSVAIKDRNANWRLKAVQTLPPGKRRLKI